MYPNARRGPWLRAARRNFGGAPAPPAPPPPPPPPGLAGGGLGRGLALALPPAGGYRLRLRAEPALALRFVDDSVVVVVAAGDVVYLLAPGQADVALDQRLVPAAGGGRWAGG